MIPGFSGRSRPCYLFKSLDGAPCALALNTSNLNAKSNRPISQDEAVAHRVSRYSWLEAYFHLPPVPVLFSTPLAMFLMTSGA